MKNRIFLVALAWMLGAFVPAAALGDCCTAPDNGTGTIDFPPDCPYDSPGDPMLIIDGLPPGTTLELRAPLTGFTNVVNVPGGTLGGEICTFDAWFDWTVTGTGSLTGFSRHLMMPVSGEIHIGPRNPGDPVQTFDADLFRLQGQLFGDVEVSSGLSLAPAVPNPFGVTTRIAYAIPAGAGQAPRPLRLSLRVVMDPGRRGTQSAAGLPPLLLDLAPGPRLHLEGGLDADFLDGPRFPGGKPGRLPPDAVGGGIPDGEPYGVAVRGAVLLGGGGVVAVDGQKTEEADLVDRAPAAAEIAVDEGSDHVPGLDLAVRGISETARTVAVHPGVRGGPAEGTGVLL